MQTQNLQNGECVRRHYGILVSIINSCLGNLGAVESTSGVNYRDEHNQPGDFIFSRALPKHLEGHSFTLTETFESSEMKKVLSQYLWDTTEDKHYNYLA